MKVLTCKDLGGPCDEKITGNSFKEVGANSKAHVVEQIKGGDEAHKKAVEKMRNASTEEQKSILAGFKKKYEEAPEV